MAPRSRDLYLSLSQALRVTTIPRSRAPTTFICQTCRTTLHSQRLFTTTSSQYKKTTASKKSTRQSPDPSPPSKPTHIPNNKATLNRDSQLDPHDHSALQTDIDKALTRLKDALTKTRDAGRVSSSMLEDLSVDLPSTPKETLKLRDIASIVPKGSRSMQVFLSDSDHLKPIMASILASPYSLTPQPPSPNDANQLLITVPVPPVTAETRAQAAVEAKKCTERASLDVRTARGEAQKVFRKMELQKLVQEDELRKAHRGMEEVAKKGQDEVRRVGEAAVKAVER